MITDIATINMLYRKLVLDLLQVMNSSLALKTNSSTNRSPLLASYDPKTKSAFAAYKVRERQVHLYYDNNHATGDFK